jgi:hypothetical protein
MNSSPRLFAPRSKSDWTSWGTLFKTVLLLLGALLLGIRAERASDAAKREQTSFGVVTECEHHARAGNYCHYTFSVGDERYIGADPAVSEVEFGHTVQVYYDSQDPRMNSLEDFSAESRRDKKFIYILLFAIGAFAAFVMYSLATNRGGAKRQTL